MRVAIIHYWLVGMRGGERVVESLCRIFPQADIFTHVCDPESLSETLRGRHITTTFIGRLPGAVRHYKKYLPLMPLALEQLDLSGYDLVVSSESGPAKGVLLSPHTLHVCYCHTPMRYLWDMYHQYRAGAGPITRALMGPLTHRLRIWDLASSFRVDHFIANSSFVAQRIWKHYRREAEVIPPPVDTERFAPAPGAGEYFLMVGELTRYKRPELAVEAFNQLGERLMVIGDGEMLVELQRMARPNVTLLGRQPDSVVAEHYARCRALIFPGLEDFGIVPVEAMAAGRPVIAYGRGGVLDSVLNGVTGLFFDTQSVDALTTTVRRFKATEQIFSPERIVAHARTFGRAHFEARLRGAIEREQGRSREHATPARQRAARTT